MGKQRLHPHGLQRLGTLAASVLLMLLCQVTVRPALAEPPLVAAASPWVSIATFYAEPFQGRPMANGRRYDMNDPTTTASNAWPLGTRLRVRRIPGSVWDASLTPAERRRYISRSIEVVVRDRGAFTHAVDLSRAAFLLLGRPSEGVIRVEVEALTGK